MEYQIGDFSKISRLSITTLRFYHEAGLLPPTRIDPGSGYRYYDEACFEKVRIISEFKNLDFSLDEIKEIMAAYHEDSDLINFMEQKLREVDHRIAQYRQIQDKLKLFIKKEAVLPMPNSEIVIKEVPDLRIASIRFRGKYSDVSHHIGVLYKSCGRFAIGKPFSLYYDGDYKEENADIEICVAVSKEVSKGTVKSRKLSGGQVISMIHKGPYENIGLSYKRIIDYVTAAKIKTVLPSREIYLKGPGMIFKGNPNNYLTEIQILTE